MENNLYYKKNIGQLEVYQKLIQYWSMIFDKREEIYVLDNMNFNLSLFPEIITFNELSSFHSIEPGYTSPDGYTEMNMIIRDLEYQRLLVNNPEVGHQLKELITKAGVGCGNGCTNVMNAVVNSIIKLNQQESAKQIIDPEVILILPNYTVYTAQLSNISNSVKPKYVYTKRENDFLPTLEEIQKAITDKTLAIVITYPNNPAQSTYEGEGVQELQNIVKLCQEKGVFLIVDNIYQDLVFPIGRKFVEIFNLTDSPECVVKVYGSSKDTPFFSGYRTGYWIGDPRLMDIYKYYISSTENSLNTYSLSIFALNLYFKLKSIKKEKPLLEDMKYFNQGVFGWSQVVDEEVLYNNLISMNLFEKYQERITQANKVQQEAINRTIAYVEQSKVYSDYINQNIGNVFFIKVNSEYFKGTNDEFFHFIFSEAKCGVLPGSVFGIEIPGEVWFRITLLHDEIENIINYLGKIEKTLLSNSQKKEVKAMDYLANGIIGTDKYDKSMESIAKLNNEIRNLVAVSIDSIDFNKVGYCGTREGFMDGQAIERAIVILRGVGCQWAREDNGGCTMCGHLSGSAKGSKVTDDKLKNQFEDAIANLDFSKYPMLCLYNGGSFLNEDEISPELRRYIFNRISGIKEIKTLIIESRKEHITDEVLDEIEELLPNTTVEIGVGLETVNDVVRNIVLNKGTNKEDYIALGQIFKNRRTKLLLYILIKSPFLTEYEAIEDSVSTIEFAREIGADIISLEAVSIQDQTFVSYLAGAGAYTTPWIWTVFEIIKRTYQKDMIFRIGGFEFFPIPKEFTSNCPECNEEMLKIIQEFNKSNNIEVLKDAVCKNECNKEWEQELQTRNSDNIYTRIVEAIEKIDSQEVFDKMKAF